MTNQERVRRGIISEVGRFIMNFAEYSTLDTFHIPLEVMKSLFNGVIPYDDKIREQPDETEKF